jgi:23S rRNA (uracil747-C5)-methyltransferase
MQTRHPWANVISCNIQPLPAAVLEGPDEVLLTPQRFMRERYGPVTLLCAPQSFIQVTHEVAAQLYQAAAQHVQENQFSSALDLFCGIGGFSYAVAPYVQNITGVELSTAAIESARAAATFNGPAQPLFFAADADTFNLAEVTPQPELVIVNPPRRGLSSDILQRLMQLAPRSILYSSCNPATFARDVRILLDSGGYTLDAAQPFDMFPLTHHCEVLGTLSR